MTIYCSFSKRSVMRWLRFCQNRMQSHEHLIFLTAQVTELILKEHFLMLHLTGSIKDPEAYIKHSTMSSNMWPCNPVYSVISGYLLCQLLLTGLGIHPHVYTMVIHVWARGLSPAELRKGHILTHMCTHTHLQPHKHVTGCGGRRGN